jgi:hypothetical protein
MIEIAKLCKQIRTVLSGENPGAADEALAAHYGRLCHEACRRLEACAAMLEKGSDYQALQLAETEPVLLDLIAALSFEESQEWREYCKANELVVPEAFDSKAVQALDRLYSKGISPNHPLYKEYRGAVTSRDDVKALRIMRSIVRLNPADANAKSELKRLENKHFQLTLQELRKSLSENHEVAAISHLAELERLSTPAQLEEISEYKRACEIRRMEAYREALSTAQRLADSLDEEYQSGAWRMVGEIVARIRFLQQEHGFALSISDEKKCADMQGYYATHRAEFDQAVRFNQALSALAVQIDQIDTRLLARSTLGIEEAENLQVGLNQLWMAVEDFKRTVPDALTMRVSSSGSALRSEVNRLQQSRRTKIISISAVAILLVGVAVFFTTEAMRAADFATQLARLQETGQVAATEKIIFDLRSQSPRISANPRLKSRLEEAEQWARTEREKCGAFEKRLTELEAALNVEAARIDPEAVTMQIDSANQLIDSVAADQRPNFASRLVVARNKFESNMAAIREAFLSSTDKELVELANLSSKKLNYEQSKFTIDGALAEIEPHLKRLEAHVNTRLAALQLPPAHQTRISELRSRFDLFVSERQKFAAVDEALLKATTLEGYLEALQGMKNSQLRQDAAVINARKLIDRLPKTDELLQDLLLPADPAGWEHAKANNGSENFFPSSPIGADKQKLMSLRSDEYLNGVSEATIVFHSEGGKQETWYFKGELTLQKMGGGLITTSSHSGNLYRPSGANTDPLFVKMTAETKKTPNSQAGREVVATRMSASSQCIASLSLNRMTDENAAKFQVPLLRILGDLMRDKSANAVFKAYLIQQLGEMLLLRKYEWGWQYCGSLRSDLEELSKICAAAPLRSKDWLSQTKNAQLGPRLSKFFGERATRDYLAEATLHRDILRGVLASGLRFGGFIDNDVKPHLLGEASSRGDLWVLAADGRRLIRCSANDLNMQWRSRKLRDLRLENVEYVNVPLFQIAADLAERVNKIYGSTEEQPLTIIVSQPPAEGPAPSASGKTSSKAPGKDTRSPDFQRWRDLAATKLNVPALPSLGLDQILKLITDQVQAKYVMRDGFIEILPASVELGVTPAGDFEKHGTAGFSPVFYVPLDRKSFHAGCLKKLADLKGSFLKLPSIPWCDDQ